MTYYELFQQGPAVYVPVLLFSLVLTVVAYGAVPFIIAKTRKTPITKKKYRGLCYGINVAVMFLFIVINGEASSGGPYLLWTWVFSSYGIKVLGTRGIMTDSGYLKDDPCRITECKSCGYRDKKFFDACPKCGKYAKQYIYLNQSSSANDDKTENTSSFPNLDIDKMTPTEAAEYLFAEQLGEKYAPQENQKNSKGTKAKYCSQCGSPIDNETKKCTGCGKQYFRGLRLNKFSVTVIIMTLVILAVSALCVFQYLNTQITTSELKAEVSRLEQQAKTKDATIKRLEGEIDDLEDETWDKLYFFDTYAVMVNNGSKKYHKYGCSDFDESYFWIYNIDAAEDNGYYACSKCH